MFGLVSAVVALVLSGASSAVAPAPAGVLPAPLRVSSGGDEFVARRDGTVARLEGARGPRDVWSWAPGGSLWQLGPDAVLVLERGTGRLVVMRSRRAVWRSSGSDDRRFLGGAAGDGSRVAFSDSNTLYLTDGRGPERAIARRERPLGWTRAGLLLTARWAEGGMRIAAFDRLGRRRHVVARRIWSYGETLDGRFLLTDRHGRLLRTDGRSLEALADLRARGLGARPYAVPLAGGLIGGVDVHARRLVVFRSDGTVFARTGLPHQRQARVSYGWNVSASADGSAVAFTGSRGNDGYGATGTETVYVLRAGDRRARPVFSRRLRFAPCERYAALSWRAGSLLYWPSEGRGTVIAPATGHVVRLGPLLRGLPGSRAGGDGRVRLRVEWM